jgi:hypothetical protein
MRGDDGSASGGGRGAELQQQQETVLGQSRGGSSSTKHAEFLISGRFVFKDDSGKVIQPFTDVTFGTKTRTATSGKVKIQFAGKVGGGQYSVSFSREQLLSHSPDGVHRETAIIVPKWGHCPERKIYITAITKTTAVKKKGHFKRKR